MGNYNFGQLQLLDSLGNHINTDNGPEFSSSTFIQWAGQHQIKINDIQPGCHYQNADVERFNRTYRNESLDLYIFTRLQDVVDITNDWIRLYIGLAIRRKTS